MLACFTSTSSFVPASSPLIFFPGAQIVGPSHESLIYASDHHMVSHAMPSS